MSKLIERTAKGTIWHGASQVALTVAGYVVAVIIARVLGPAEFGTYGVIYSFLMTLELTMLFGIPAAVTRLIADGKDEDGAISGTGFTLVFILCSIAFTAVWLLAPLLARWLGVPDAARLFRIAAIDIPFFGLYFLISHTLNGRRDFAGQSVATLLSSATRVAGTAGLAMFGLTIAGAFIVNVAASIVRLSFVFWRGDRRLFTFRLTAAKPILSVAAAVSAITVGAQLLLNLDLWFLGSMSATVGADTIGHYVAAKNIARLPNLIAFVMNAVLIPSIAHAAASGDNETAGRIIRGTMRFLALTLVPGCALLMLDADAVMGLLFSKEYTSSGAFLQLLLLANGLLHTLCSTLITVLVATRHQKWGSVVALGSLVPAVVLSLVLVPRFGAMGAATAAASSAALACLFAIMVTRRFVDSLTDSWLVPKVLLALAIPGAISWFIPATGLLLVIKLAVLFSIFIGAALLLGLLSRADLLMFKGGKR